jgi:hypothetical protein
MKSQTLLKAAAGLGTVALALTMSACSHNNAATSDYGNVRTEQTAQQQATPDQVIAATPAPANTQGLSGTQTPAIIPGPAKVDSTGRLYTSSSVGSAGNGSITGTNTDVNIIPQKPAASTVTVTETPAPLVTTTTVIETPAPAPVVVEVAPAPAPAPPVVETPAPMASSTTTQTTHKRLRKD